MRRWLGVAYSRWCRRAALALVCGGLVLALNGCAFLTQWFWQCRAGNGDACQHYYDYSEAQQNPPPAAPRGLVATVQGADVLLRWDPNVERDTVYYEVYRSQTPGGPYARVDVALSPDYRDTKAPPNVRSYYVVAARSQSSLISEPSDEVSARPVGGSVRGPAAPRNLIATRHYANIDLVWDVGSESPVFFYRIYRSATPGGPYTHLGTAPNTSFRDSSPPGGVRSYYTVRAVDSTGAESAPSNEASAVPCSDPTCAQPVSGKRVPARLALRGFRLAMQGDVIDRHGITASATRIVGRNVLFGGTLTGYPRAPALRRLSGGKWRALVGFAINAGNASGTASGVALATFNGRGAGRACIRFKTSARAAANGQRTLDGTFKLLWATGAAARLTASGRFTGSPTIGRSWMLTTGARARPARHRAIPAICRTLARR